MLGGSLAASVPASSCSGPTSAGGELQLLLSEVAWPKDPGVCKRLVRFVDLEAPPYTEDDAQRVERLLLEPGFFSQAQCQTSDRRLTCQLIPRDIVVDVRFSGKLPLPILQADLRRRVFLRAGTLLDDETAQVAQQEKRLVDYLTGEGYFGSRVRIAVLPQGDVSPNRGVALVAHIEVGQPVLLRKLTVVGKSPIAAVELKRRITHYWFFFVFQARFKPRELEDDTRNIASDLQERGWPEALVRGEYSIDKNAGAADVVIHVDAGPGLHLRFLGNHIMTDAELTKLATFREAGVVDPIEVENTAAAIKAAYQRRGYYRVEVAHEIEHDTGEVTVRYEIVEGPQAEVTEVLFHGNRTLSKRVLVRRAQLSTRKSALFVNGRWVDDWVKRDVQELVSAYHKEGFADAEVHASYSVIAPGKLRVVFDVHEGERRIITEVPIVGLPNYVDEASLRRRLRLTPGKPYVPEELDGDHRIVFATLAASGYLNANVEQQPEVAPTGDVTIRYVIDAGARAYYGGVLVRGNIRTRRSFVAGELRLESDAPLDLASVAASRTVLRNLGIFSSVDLQPLGAWRAGHSTWLLAALREQEQRTLDGAVAFSTDELFSVGGSFRDRNFLGRAVRLDVELQLSNADGLVIPKARIGKADRGQLLVRAPHPLGLNANFNLAAIYEFQRKTLFRERRLGASVGLSRGLLARSACSWCPDISGALAYELVYTDFRLRGREVPPATAVELARQATRNGTIARLVPKLGFDRRDSFTDPRAGYVGNLRLEIASRYLAAGFEDAANFGRLTADAHTYHRLLTTPRQRFVSNSILGGPFVASLGLHAGVIQVLPGKRGVPASETFYYGGDTNVRGIRERASELAFPGARLLVAASAELRWYFWQNIGFGSFQLAGFVDSGTVGYRVSQLYSTASTTVSAGPVLRYVTPVGPISLAYGWPFVRARGIPPQGRLHFTFGYAF